ncbi:MAG: alpha/beta hydrolase [Pseudomonadota bacterium]
MSQGTLIAQTPVGAIEYAERGVRPRLLSIRGAGGGNDQGLALAAEVAGERFRAIAPSRFGYLGTPVPVDISVHAQEVAHAALLNTLQVESVVVMGTSAGALSAMELAICHPRRVRALILIAPASYSPDSPAGRREEPAPPTSILAGKCRSRFRLVDTREDDTDNTYPVPGRLARGLRARDIC